MGQAALLRAVLSSDGRLKAVFDDNSVLTVEPSGAAFTATLPNGDTVQQMSCYATRRRGCFPFVTAANSYLCFDTGEFHKRA